MAKLISARPENQSEITTGNKRKDPTITPSVPAKKPRMQAKTSSKTRPKALSAKQAGKQRAISDDESNNDEATPKSSDPEDEEQGENIDLDWVYKPKNTRTRRCG